MKARTARERQVVGLSAFLPRLTPNQEKEASRLLGDMFIGKHEGWCSVCGAEMPSEALWNNKRKKYTICPHCGARVAVTRSPRKQDAHDAYYYTVVQTMQGWQVLRNFFCTRDTRRSVKIAGVEAVPAAHGFSMTEVAQTWIDGKGTPVFMGRSCWYGGYYMDKWRFTTPMTIKNEHQRYYLSGELASRPQLLPILKRNGLKKLRDDVRPYDQIVAVLNCPEAETLAKAGQWSLFKEASYYMPRIRRYWPSIKIALRNGYQVKDASLWLDYLDALERNGKDLHNAKYVCPEDLHKAHDKELDAERRAERKRRLEAARLERMALAEKLDVKSKLNREYRQRIGKMLAVVVEAGDITLEPLQNIKDFYTEGETLHHCVFQMNYYTKADCLIIGAKVKGERTETIEIDTKNWRIVQCRGKYNQDSAYHQQIYKLATDNLQKFRRCM